MRNRIIKITLSKRKKTYRILFIIAVIRKTIIKLII